MPAADPAPRYLTSRRGKTRRGKAASLVVHRSSGVRIRNELFGDSYKVICGVWLVRPWVMMAIPKELGRALCRKCFATESHVVTDQGIVRLLGGSGAGIPGVIPARGDWIGHHGHHG